MKSILSSFKSNVYEACCNQNQGKLIFWECYNNGFTDCSKYRTGYWCDFGNGTQIKVNELKCELNLTNG